MKISQNLKNLADYFSSSPLYAVGGAPRAAILNIQASDIDLASAVPSESVIKVLENSPYKVTSTSPKMGTLKISIGEESYEYTTFRKESYTIGHTPDKVEFIADLKEDALRRDFRANAVYFDIKKEEYVDPLGGIEDIKSRIYRVAKDNVFNEDGLRIMRLVRQSCELNFEIDPDTFLLAKKNAFRLSEISPERIKEELDKILIADTRYPELKCENAHYRGLKLLIELDAVKYILPEILEGKDLKQNIKYHKFDVLEHTLKTVQYAPKKIRLAALFHDIAKPPIMKKNGNAHGHEMLGAKMTEEIMERLRYPKSTIAHTARLVEGHMYDLKEEAKDRTLRKFIQKNHDIILDLVALKKADGQATGMADGKINIRMEKVYYDMINENIPFTVSDLYLRGSDLIKMDIEPIKIGIALTSLLGDSVMKKKTKEEEINYILSHKKEF